MDIKRSGSQPSGNPATVYAGGSAVSLFKSTDGGAPWRQAGQGLSGAVGVTALAIDPSHSTNIYAGSTQGIFRSVDGALTFSAFSIGLTNPSVSALVFDSTGSLHAATDGGGVFDYEFLPNRPLVSTARRPPAPRVLGVRQ